MTDTDMVPLPGDWEPGCRECGADSALLVLEVWHDTDATKDKFRCPECDTLQERGSP